MTRVPVLFEKDSSPEIAWIESTKWNLNEISQLHTLASDLLVVRQSDALEYMRKELYKTYDAIEENKKFDLPESLREDQEEYNDFLIDLMLNIVKHMKILEESQIRRNGEKRT